MPPGQAALALPLCGSARPQDQGEPDSPSMISSFTLWSSRTTSSRISCGSRASEAGTGSRPCGGEVLEGVGVSRASLRSHSPYITLTHTPEPGGGWCAQGMGHPGRPCLASSTSGPSGVPGRQGMFISAMGRGGSPPLLAP